MARYSKTPKVVPIVLSIIGLFVAVVAIFSLARVMFFPGGDTNVTVDVGREALLNLDVKRSVSMNVRNEIVASEDFRQYKIVVSPESRTITVYKGYNNQVLTTKTYKNSTAAYEQFVYALDRVGMVDGNELTGDANDTRGVCATGDLYEFQVSDNNQSVKKLWTTSCSSDKGSLDAKLSSLTKLFRSQIPDIESITKGL